MSEQTVTERLEENLDRTKKVASEAGSVEFLSVDDAIKLEEYKAKIKKRPSKRIAVQVLRTRDF